MLGTDSRGGVPTLLVLRPVELGLRVDDPLARQRSLGGFDAVRVVGAGGGITLGELLRFE